jgi:hypothetical protein
MTTTRQTVIGDYRIRLTSDGDVIVDNEKTGYTSTTFGGGQAEYDAACRLAQQVQGE